MKIKIMCRVIDSGSHSASSNLQGRFCTAADSCWRERHREETKEHEGENVNQTFKCKNDRGKSDE